MHGRGVAKNFLHALQLGGLDYEGRCDVESLAAEDNLDAIRDVLRVAYEKYPSATWVANITGGTKPMSIATYEFFNAKAGNIVYTNVARPNILLDLSSSRQEKCEYKLSIDEFLAGYGFESRKKESKIQEAEARAREWAPCAKLITEYASSDDLLLLSKTDRDKARKKGWEIQPGELKTASKEVASALRDIFSLKGDPAKGDLHGKVDKYGAEFLTGGWLEVFFWDLLSRHRDALGLWDVRLGLHVGRKGDSGNKEQPASPNEYDVVFMREYGLEMVECKSGSQEHDTGSDILYKVEAVIRQFRALRVRSYLATTGSNVLDLEGNLKKSVNDRASIFNCRVITSSEIKQLAVGDDSPDTVRRIVFNATEPKG